MTRTAAKQVCCGVLMAEMLIALMVTIIICLHLQWNYMTLVHVGMAGSKKVKNARSGGMTSRLFCAMMSS